VERPGKEWRVARHSDDDRSLLRRQARERNADLGLVLGSIYDDSSQLLLVPGLSSLECKEEVGHVTPQRCYLPLHHKHVTQACGHFTRVYGHVTQVYCVYGYITQAHKYVRYMGVCTLRLLHTCCLATAFLVAKASHDSS